MTRFLIQQYKFVFFIAKIKTSSTAVTYVINIIQKQ